MTTTLYFSIKQELIVEISYKNTKTIHIPIRLTKAWYACGMSYNFPLGELTIWCRGLSERINITAGCSSNVALPLSTIELAEQISIILAGLPRAAANTAGSRQSFNGLIEYPTLFNKALSLQEMQDIAESDFTKPNIEKVFASWDFSIGIDSDQVIDRGGLAQHGELIGQPARAIPGRKWHPDMPSWKYAPNCYSAIHFHSSDLIDAEWATDFNFVVPENLSSGMYAAKLYNDGLEFYIPFVIRTDKPKARIAMLIPTATYSAYQNHRARYFSAANERLHGRLNVLDKIDLMFLRNKQFGLSTYDKHADGSGVFYSSAFRPAFNIKPSGRLWNFAADLLVIKWLESTGHPVDYITDENLDREGYSAIKAYDVLITGSHPEYVSTAMYSAIETFVLKGKSLMYLGGNGFYWRIAFHPTKRSLIEIRRSDGVRSWDAGPGRIHMSFSGERSGLWRANGKPPQKLLGVGFIGQGFDVSSFYRRTSESYNHSNAWIFEGIDSEVIGDFGLMQGGAAGLELDAVDYDLGTPENTIILATSENHSNIYELASEEVLTPHGATDGILCSRICSNIVVTRPFVEGGWVFSAGSIAFAGALAHNDCDNNISKLCENILEKFLAGTK